MTPDVVAGTSIGALIAGVHLAGHLPTLEAWARRLTRPRLLAYLDPRMSGGGLIGDDTVVMFNGEFGEYKAMHFDPARMGIFRYSIHCHRYNSPTNSSTGVAEINGDDSIVSLQNFLTFQSISVILMHELGHNLGLRHGGLDAVNYKPNYNSVMNYRFALPGLDIDCDGAGDFQDREILPDVEASRADDATDTAIGRAFAAASETLHIAAARPQLIWLHSRGMYGPWDAPLELQEVLLARDEGDPPPADVIEPPDPAGIMNLNHNTLVVTPDGRSYGYGWHRATSDLYVVEGLAS